MAENVLVIDSGSVIASGNAINLMAIEHTLSMNGFWNVPQVPSKDTGSSHNLRLAQGKYTGYANPTHSITGIYDATNNTAYDNFNSLANEGFYFATGSMLSGMILAGTPLALIDANMIGYSNYGSGSMVYVVPVSYKAVRTPESDKGAGSTGYLIEYSMDFAEVQV